MGLRRELKTIFPPERVLSSALERHAFARDASFYRLVPRVVLKPEHEGEIQSVLHYAQSAGHPVVFRGAGTNLSGQAITDSILIEIRKGWRDYRIGPEGETITLDAGVIGSWANQWLAPFGRKIGPDPGSINAAVIGGIVINNASGISSGIEYNAYNTLESMRIVLPTGDVVDTSRKNADQQFRNDLPQIYKGLLKIRDELRSNEILSQKIRHKFRLKNTMGYALNAFLDYDSPADILAHLMVGSEGTLGFLSQVTLRTRENLTNRATALLLFPDLDQAVKHVSELKKLKPEALEILDESALKSIRHIAGIPESVAKQLPAGTAALLVEFSARNKTELNHTVSAARKLIPRGDLLEAAAFSTDEEERAIIWKVRRELGTLHAGQREAGHTIISEDVCFPLESLAKATAGLRQLLNDYQYRDAIIFGHAGDGNLHFKLSVDFQAAGTRERYRAFMEQLVKLVVDEHDGSLKAEHGTGRNMAPFLEHEWGIEAVEVMRRVKTLLDPNGILNPDVIFSSDPLIHLANLKSMPRVHSEIDACIECGLCETSCPSGDLTLSPRQRITVLREMTTLSNGNHSDHLQAQAIQNEFQYQGVDTCARDGLCSVACPLDINTGKLMKAYEAHDRSRLTRQAALWVARHFAGFTLSVRVGLRIMKPISRLLKRERMQQLGTWMHRLSWGLLPSWNAEMQGAAHQLPEPPKVAAAVDEIVYFPTCLTRTMQVADPATNEASLPEALLDVLREAQIKARYPQSIREHCCGLAFHSKGLSDAAVQSASRLVDDLYEETEHGKLPILVDTSPCTRFISQYESLLSGVSLAKWRELTFYDIIEYIHDNVLPRVELQPLEGQVVLHPTCSTREMHLEGKMEGIARQCASDVLIPQHAGCCAFAGDRGLRIPELTRSATEMEAAEVQQVKGAVGHYSTSRTCEIGMSQATGREYRSLVQLVHRAMIK